ncbi:transcription initiation factor TFIID subunit 11 [Actinomortierella wolfii]|nr:transcription initiation factor TFIID subunit 11 [Actinomortierella wolfii]
MSASLPPQPPGGGGYGMGPGGPHPGSSAPSSGSGTPSTSGTFTPSMGSSATMSGMAPAPTTSTTTTTTGRKRKNTALFPIIGKKKHKLPRNLDSITARNQLPDVPTSGGRGSGQKGMIKGPYKKRQKKDKDGNPIPNPEDAKKDGGATAGASSATGPDGLKKGDDGNDSDADIKKPTDGEGGEGGTGENKGEDEDDDQEEEPEYSEFEWLQEANQRGRSKEELKALLDCFSPEQLQRYEVYRRSVLSRPTIKKLVATILNQQVSQTMAFVVAGFCKVFVGEMVEKAKEVMEDWGDVGPIRPEHLREAQRRYKAHEVNKGTGVKTSGGYQRRLFCK